jgi:hypothetical protein
MSNRGRIWNAVATTSLCRKHSHHPTSSANQKRQLPMIGTNNALPGLEMNLLSNQSG